MSWNNCKKCVFVPRSSFSSALFKVLITLKLLHGSRTGAKGATFEDIAMHMIKHFCLDGDIKSQVLASLKYGVKMHFINKRKDKFSLILPASSIHLAPCKFKNEETGRIQCIFPSMWYSNVCNDVCAPTEQTSSCCGKRKRSKPNVCCQEQEESDENPCALCKKKSKPCQPKKNTCNVCVKKSKPCSSPCPRPPRPPSCSRPPRPPSCPEPCYPEPSCDDSSTSEDPCSPCYPPPKKSKPCPKPCPKPSCSDSSASEDPCSSCYSPPKKSKPCPKPCPKPICSDSSASEDPCSSCYSPPKKSKPCSKPCPKIRQPVCSRRRGTCGKSSKSLYDDYCQMCPKDDDDDDDMNAVFASDAHNNCSCCQK